MPVACYPEIVRLHIKLFLRPTWESRMLPLGEGPLLVVAFFILLYTLAGIVCYY